MVTMSASSVEVLQKIYGADPEKIVVIPHGVPELAVEDRDAAEKAGRARRAFRR